MKANVDGIFKVEKYGGGDPGSNAYLAWCRQCWDYTGTVNNQIFSRIDGKPFFVQKIIGCSGDQTTIYVLELNNAYTALGKSTTGKEYLLNRQVLGIRMYHYISSGLYADKMDGSVLLYSCASPYKYRISGGKLYQQERNISEDWTPVQKIKLGTCDIYNGEICNLTLRSAASMQWMVDGNNLSTI